MNTTKSFCIDCETLQYIASTCTKCKSQNIFEVGSQARFYKHPKKRDYEEVFIRIISRATQTTENRLYALQKYIHNHKMGNKTYGRFYSNKKTFIEMIDEEVKKYEDKIEINKKELKFEGELFPFTYFPSNPKIIDKFLYDYTNGYTRKNGWAIPIYEGVLHKIYKSKGNPFRPVRVSLKSDKNMVFKDKKTALAFSQYFAALFVKEIKKYSKPTDILTPELITHANKHAENCNYSLDKNFSEYMV